MALFPVKNKDEVKVLQYREFGTTGEKVSRLGFGAMRLPQEKEEAVSILRRGMELGINYFDTAPGYMDDKSEDYVGAAIRGRRDEVYLSTKNPIRDASGENWLRRLESSLERLGVDYIDFYHMWSINWELYREKIDVPKGPLWAAEKALEQGLIRYLSFSFHDKAENLFKLIDTGHFSTLLCQYNLLDRANEEAMQYAKEKGLGVAVMGPVGGGRLGAASSEIAKLVPERVKSTPEAALRFVFSNPHVDLVLSGMSSMEMVAENVKIAGRADQLTQEERAGIIASTEENRKLEELYCTGCDYCLPCSQGVNIPRNFELMNYHRIWGLTEYAKEHYAGLEEKERGDNCISCGSCERKCPQKLPISKKLEETAKVLGR